MTDDYQPENKHGAEHLKPWQFPKGTSGNPKGRPKSPITRIKEIWNENPELYDEWVVQYMEDKNNRKHVVEMVEGKPKQQTDITTKGEAIKSIIIQKADEQCDD